MTKGEEIIRTDFSKKIGSSDFTIELKNSYANIYNLLSNAAADPKMNEALFSEFIGLQQIALQKTEEAAM